MFIGRKRELEELNARYRSGRKEFGVLYGARRIGKSTLIDQFMLGKKGLFFQAKKDSLYGNLKSFSYAVNRQLNLPLQFVFSSMEEAFDALIRYAKDDRFIIAIDEYPYIVSQDASFPSVLQSIVDRAPDNLFFLICGSDLSMMKREIMDHSAPLYKRRTFEMNVRKLRYEEALDYLKSVSNEEKVKYLALTSTYPYYLSAMDFSISFEENIRRLLFNEYGAFFNLPDQVLSNALDTQDVYNAILHAVSRRRRSNKDIADYIHEEEAKVSKYIKTLVTSELLDRRETFMGSRKTVYYEIGDPMLRFWYRFVFEETERIKINGELVLNGLKDEIASYIATGFEDVARMYMDALNARGDLGDVFQPFKPFTADRSCLGRSVQLDGLSENDDTLIVLECKFRKEPFSLPMLEHLKESATIFPNRLKRIYYLFSKSGFTDELIAQSGDDCCLVGLNDLFSL